MVLLCKTGVRTKNIECMFGELVSKWHILKCKFWLWYLDNISNVVKCCVIMHNMIVEDCHGDLSIDDEDDEIHVPDTQAGPENNNAPENLLFLGFVESQFMDTA